MFEKSNFDKPKMVPKNAILKSKTVHYDIWEYPVVLPNGGTAVYEMCVRQNAAMVLAEQNGEIVISRQTQQFDIPPKYFMLGGMIEKGESPLRAAKRELAEESGLTSNDWELLGVINHNNRVMWTDYFYMARNCKNTCQPDPDSGEFIEIIRFPINQFMNEILVSEDFREKSLRQLLMKTPSTQDIAIFKKLTRTY